MRLASRIGPGSPLRHLQVADAYASKQGFRFTRPVEDEPRRVRTTNGIAGPAATVVDDDEAAVGERCG